MPLTWNPWHGCHKLSEGCANCYVFRTDEKHGRDSRQVEKNAAFDLPMRRSRSRAYSERTSERSKEPSDVVRSHWANELVKNDCFLVRLLYRIPPGELVYTCFSSDLLVEDADPWRGEVWQMMRMRPDLRFVFLTKRIHRLAHCLPVDWGEGYPNVQICCTAENQARVQERLPLFLQAPIARRGIVCEPLLGPVDLSPYLGPWISQVVAGGESGSAARVCDHAWILSLGEQCLRAKVPFHFQQTGARFLKDGRLYRVPRPQQHSQARKAGVSHDGVSLNGGKGFPFE